MISPLTSEKIERASQLVREMERIENELRSIFNGRAERSSGRTSVEEAEAVAETPKKRKMSPAARARIASAQRARWAKARSAAGKPASSTKTTAPKGVKKKRMMSPEARARIAAAQKKRWAKFRRSK
jgi:hypothetical protein